VTADSGPGFFTLPMAEMVESDGLVVAVDLQGATPRVRGARTTLFERL
jgi:hypothetical protein